MKPLRAARKYGLLVAYVVAMICACALPVHAAADVDFNGDGVPDPVVIQHSPDRIIIRVSGSQPQILHVKGRILAIVATDLNHDGQPDITALSERRGVQVWLNSGTRGHFKPATRKVRRHILRWSRRGRSATRTESDDESGKPIDTVGAHALTVAEQFRDCTLAPLSLAVTLHVPHGVRSNFAVVSSSRAPPQHTLQADCPARRFQL